MRYIVLGGGGSFGLAVSNFLLTQESTERVVGIGRNSPKPPCFTLNTGRGDRRYEYRAFHTTYELDMLLDFVCTVAPNVIINFAAQGEGATSFNHSWRYFETNAMGLTRLVERLMKCTMRTPRFIHVGTSELYGSQTDTPADENTPIKPTSPYAASKAAFDLYLQALHAKTGFPMNIVRPSNCYGPGQQLHRIIPRAILCGLTGEKLPLHGGGKAEKSYMHTNDLATAIWCVLHHGTEGEIYNAGPAMPTPIREVVERIAYKLRMRFEDLCEVTEDRAHQDSRYWLDSGKLNRLGWKPRTDWNNGLSNMVSWVNLYKDELAQQPKDFVMRG